MEYYQFITSDGKSYSINPPLISNIFATANYYAHLNASAVVKQTRGNFTICGRLPNTGEVVADQKGASRRRESIAVNWPAHYLPGFNTVLRNTKTENLSMLHSHEIEKLREDVRYAAKKGAQNKSEYFAKWKRATGITTRSIADSVQHAENGIWAAKLIRDTAIEVEVIGITILAGKPAGAAASGLLKGGAKYQDTGSVSQALLTAGTEFAVGVIPTGEAGDSIAKHAALVFAKKTTEIAGKTAVGVADGLDIADALTVASIETGIGSALSAKSDFVSDSVIKSLAGETSEEIIKKTIKKYAIPLSIIGGIGAQKNSMFTAAVTGESTKDIQKKLADKKRKQKHSLVQASRVVASPSVVMENFQHTKVIMGFEPDLAIIGP